jgi:hypothetical protein
MKLMDNATIETKVAPTVPANPDLSREIEQSAERQHDEIIKAVRVFDNCYRCNWWVQDKSPQASWLATGTIRKSRLVRATQTNGALVMQDVATVAR